MRALGLLLSLGPLVTVGCSISSAERSDQSDARSVGEKVEPLAESDSSSSAKRLDESYARFVGKRFEPLAEYLRERDGVTIDVGWLPDEAYPEVEGFSIVLAELDLFEQLIVRVRTPTEAQGRSSKPLAADLSSFHDLEVSEIRVERGWYVGAVPGPLLWGVAPRRPDMGRWRGSGGYSEVVGLSVKECFERLRSDPFSFLEGANLTLDAARKSLFLSVFVSGVPKVRCVDSRSTVPWDEIMLFAPYDGPISRSIDLEFDEDAPDLESQLGLGEELVSVLGTKLDGASILRSYHRYVAD